MKSPEGKDIILRLSNISKLYPGMIALRDVNLEIEKGTVHGLIGKNGAGKSTLVNIISGVITPTFGEIEIGEHNFSSLTRMTAQEYGVSIVTQDAKVIPEFTVAETLFSPNYIMKNRVIDWQEIYLKADEIAGKAGFKLDTKMKIRDLPLSVQQFILILKAFYVDNSDVVILDEASASLSAKDQALLFNIVKIAREHGKTILYISHRMDEILSLCDKVTVIRDGRTIATEDCANLDRKKLSSYIVGSSDYESNENDAARSIKGRKMFSAKNITKVGVFDKISFDVKMGEIVGFAGLRGSGRTELFKAIAGIEPFDSGVLELEDKEILFKNPWDALEKGVVYLPEEREKEGLVIDHSVKQNLVISAINRLIMFNLINRKREEGLSDELIGRLDIKAIPEQEVGTLSGGNRQKVVIGKVIATEPKLLLLDEPTKGIDIAVKASVLKIIKEDLSKTNAIVISSPGLSELLEICDRILVLSKGKIVKEFARGTYDEQKIYSYM